MCQGGPGGGTRRVSGVQMRPRLLIGLLAAFGFTAARPAAAQIRECPIAQIGQACTNATCIGATCCDDPTGCRSSIDAGGSGSSSSSSGGPAGTGTPRACAVCQFLVAEYCRPADVGSPCGDGGTCSYSGGGGGPAMSLDGGTTSVNFGFTTCTDTVPPADGGAPSSSSSSGGIS